MATITLKSLGKKEAADCSVVIFEEAREEGEVWKVNTDDPVFSVGAFDGDRPVGLSVVLGSGREKELQAMVSPFYRRRGIGTGPVRALLEEACAQQVDTLIATCVPFSPMQSILEAQGFEPDNPSDTIMKALVGSRVFLRWNKR